MTPINKVQLTGNLGNDPAIKSFETGSRKASFTMATNETFTRKGGEKETRTEWHTVVAWGKLADQVESEFKKGSFVSVVGRISNRTFIDKEGQKRYFTEIVANEVVLNKKEVEKLTGE